MSTRCGRTWPRRREAPCGSSGVSPKRRPSGSDACLPLWETRHKGTLCGRRRPLRRITQTRPCKRRAVGTRSQAAARRSWLSLRRRRGILKVGDGDGLPDHGNGNDHAVSRGGLVYANSTTRRKLCFARSSTFSTA